MKKLTLYFNIEIIFEKINAEMSIERLEQMIITGMSFSFLNYFPTLKK